MKKIGLFCGGYSSEFDISIKSANTILEHFPENYQGIKIIVKEGPWEAVHSDYNGIFDRNTGAIITQDQRIPLDGAIVYIHGDPGENGKIQAVLDLLDIPYVNSEVLPSALSFDKWYCNQFLNQFGIPVAKALRLLPSDQVAHSEIAQQIGFPMFVKPTGSGSSYGISKVKRLEDLENALVEAFKEGGMVIIESFLPGTEVTCGVYRTKNGLVALPLTEIVSENEFFDYEAKYMGKSQEITPARIPASSTQLIQQKAQEIYTLLNLKSVARIDFMLVGETPFVIEVNTTPGFSKESIVPKMLQEAQLPIELFWHQILSTELESC